jgi:hypothetical protein
MSPEDLRRKIQVRQDFVAGCLQEFRERMNGARGKGEPKPKVVAETVALKDLMAQLKEAGMTMDDVRRIARGRKKI